MQVKNIQLQIPVRYLKGVGPKRSSLLLELEIESVYDLLYYLPFRYEDRSELIPIRELKVGSKQAIRGSILSASDRMRKSGGRAFQAVISDRTGIIHATWFNQPYLKDNLLPGSEVVLYGKVERYDKLQIMQPEYELVKEGSGDSINMGRIVPIYSLTKDISQKYIRTLTHAAVSEHLKSIPEIMPAYLIASEHLVDIKFAISNIHFPSNFENLEKAYKRIVFDEFFILQLALAIKRHAARGGAGSGLTHNITGDLIAAFKRSLPFEFTPAQKKAVDDIVGDMSSGRVMNRLLEGDVGSGKTVVAAYAMALTIQNGFQAVIMAPTEVLARQHFIVLSEMMMPLGVSVALLVGGISEEEKEKVYSGISSGAFDIVVGTHAVLEKGVRFKNLGMVIVDEQHKFGVTQKAELKSKARDPHVLVMTATPIPRTLALTVYGDLDISVIRELPKGRKPITTYWLEEDKREGAYRFIKEELLKGRQAYVVCPLIDTSIKNSKFTGQGFAKSGADKIQNASEVYKKFKDKDFADFRVGLLHGRMDPKEKDRIMKDFKSGKIDILVSTVVIEVGVDVPNATVMLIESAERFGLSQLHQLRGRVGRGTSESYCILIADPKTETSAGRLKSIEGTLDGFEIAEADLEIRGPGEFFGTRQHGSLPEIRFGNIIKDFAIMEAARNRAAGLIKTDPNLSEARHASLKAMLYSRFKDKIDLIKVA